MRNIHNKVENNYFPITVLDICHAMLDLKFLFNTCL